MNYVSLEFNGRTIRVPAFKAQGKLWFHWLGETHVVETGLSRRSGSDKAKASPGVIGAPMPGKVTQVRIVKDQAVKKGDALVMMEAMKMEYTLEADRDGKITEVKATVGAQVSLGEVLVRIGET